MPAAVKNLAARQWFFLMMEIVQNCVNASSLSDHLSTGSSL
jgi:hypothetical protein